MANIEPQARELAEGYVAAPVDPSNSMIRAGLLFGLTPNQACAVYQSMLAALPAQGIDRAADMFYIQDTRQPGAQESVGQTELGWALKRATPEQVMEYLEDDLNLRVGLQIHLSAVSQPMAQVPAPHAQGIDLGQLWLLSEAWLAKAENLATAPLFARALYACAKELRDAITPLGGQPDAPGVSE